MRKILVSLAFLSLTSLGLAQENGVKFIKNLNWAEIKAKAKRENKLIFMDVYATWCIPCKKMDQSTYPSEKAGLFLNNKFISIKVQGDQTEQDSDTIKSWYTDAKQILKDYKITAYPTLLFFSADGKLINRSMGETTDEGLIDVARNSLDPLKRFYSRLRKYKQGKLDVSEKPELALLAKSVGELQIGQNIADDYINNYLFKLKDSELFTEEHLKFIGSFIDEKSSKSFKFFMRNSDKVNNVLGNYQAQMNIMSFISKKYLPSIFNWPTSIIDWDVIEKTVIGKFGDLGEERVYEQRLFYYMFKNDSQNLATYYMKYYRKYLRSARYVPNDPSWEIFEHIQDPVILKFACDTVMVYDIENFHQNEPMAYDTYANLLHKTGRTAQAILWQERAVKLKKGQPDEKIFMDHLEKMRSGTPTWNHL